jgi:hypothetical protein
MEFAVFKAFPEARPAMGTLSRQVNPTRWREQWTENLAAGNYYRPRESESPFGSDNDTVFDP